MRKASVEKNEGLRTGTAEKKILTIAIIFLKFCIKMLRLGRFCQIFIMLNDLWDFVKKKF